MAYLAITIILTLGVSALCSTLEAVVLSTTEIEIERLKKQSLRRGAILERCVRNIDETTSAILTANTIANTFARRSRACSAPRCFGSGIATAYVFPAALTVGILFFSEIMPKNIGIIYRRPLQPYLIYPLSWLRVAMAPMAKFTSFVLKGLKSNAPEGRIGRRRNRDAGEQGRKGRRNHPAGARPDCEFALARRRHDSRNHDAAHGGRNCGLRPKRRGVFAEHPNPNFSRFPVFRDTL